MEMKMRKKSAAAGGDGGARNGKLPPMGLIGPSGEMYARRRNKYAGKGKGKGKAAKAAIQIFFEFTWLGLKDHDTEKEEQLDKVWAAAEEDEFGISKKWKTEWFVRKDGTISDHP